MRVSEERTTNKENGQFLNQNKENSEENTSKWREDIQLELVREQLRKKSHKSTEKNEYQTTNKY
jgi:hypothetical protein